MNFLFRSTSQIARRLIARQRGAPSGAEAEAQRGCRAPTKPEVAAPLTWAKQFLLLAASALVLCCLPAAPQGGAGGGGAATAVGSAGTTPGAAPCAAAPAAALSNCRGVAEDFRWLLAVGGAEAAEGTEAAAVVGRPQNTRVVALDQQCRPTTASTSGVVHARVLLGGRAQVSPGGLPVAWANGELTLNLKHDAAELIEAQLRLDSPSCAANTSLHNLRKRVVAGAVARIDIDVRPLSFGSSRTAQPPVNASAAAWPTHLVLEVLLSFWDALGNRTPGSAIIGKGAGIKLTGSGSLEILGDGHFALEKDGRARALVRGGRAGAAELGLEAPAALAPQKALRAAGRQLRFQGPPAVGAEAIAGRGSPLLPEDAAWQARAEEVRGAFLHAWRGYRRYAWGADELQPLSKRGRNGFGNIGMTILDSLTTLHIMGFHEEFDEGAEFVEHRLRLDTADEEVSVFELTIRALGGLLGAHSLTGRPVFLQRATELADRLLPALNTSSGLPLPKWNLQRRSASPSKEPTILAEAGSLQLEFRQLAAATGDQRYSRAADACFEAIQAAGIRGIIPVHLTPPDHFPPKAIATKFAVGALADSYYEYLLKQWLQSPNEERFKAMWLLVMRQLLAAHVRPRPTSDGPRLGPPPKFKLVEFKTSGEVIAKMDHLSCFVPGMIALALMTLPASDLAGGRKASWLHLAEGLTESCIELWSSTESGLAPEYVLLAPEPPFSVREVPREGRHSFLRPETAESLFYMHRLTGKEKYRQAGARMFRAIVAHSKLQAGFASVANVNKVPTEKLDQMQSFLMAETFKYLYLLFSPREALDLDSYILNTEAHPLRKAGPIAT